MEIKIEPVDIDQYVKKAILDSTVGRTLTIEIEKSLKEMMTGYHNPVKSFVSKVLEQFVIEYMQREEVKPLLYQAIAAVITPEMVVLMVQTGCNKLRKEWENR